MSDSEDEDIDPLFDPLNPTYPPVFDGAQYLENVPEFGYFLDFDEDDEEEEDEEDEEDNENEEGEYFLLDGNYDEELIEAENREIRQEIEEQFDFFRNFMANRNGQIVENRKHGTGNRHNTVVSPVYSKFYLASAVARKGTAKSTKFTIVYSSVPDKNLHRIERLTNDLAYDHQIVFQPVGLPSLLNDTSSDEPMC
ncbi:unnamed protein product [Caenorhabditis nigoni]